MTVEEEHQDILQNIESAIIEVYRDRSDLIDAEVLSAIDALVRLYAAQAQRRTSSLRPPKGLAGQVFEAVDQICQWRLGQLDLEDSNPDNLPLDVPPVEVSVMVDCLKRIQSSIKFWSKERGRQGYLNFVNPFIY